MVERDALILSYVHLDKLPRANEALHTLKKIASLVKPIMRARGWKVKELAEFYPNQQNLLGKCPYLDMRSYVRSRVLQIKSLGLNVNMGAKICLRLRHAADQNQFMPMEHVLDTMLHELSHIVYGPHDSDFHALWDQLRDEQQGLLRKGFTGENFLSDGRRLGGARIPLHEARRLAREAALKRQKRPLGTGSGHRLGGAAPMPGQDIRRVIAEATQRRNTTLKGCGTDRLSDVEIINISDTATRNGFKTQAEEDEANEAAIAQALWELVQEDEKARYGSAYIPPSADNPAGNGGWMDVTKAAILTGSGSGSKQTEITRERFGKPTPPKNSQNNTQADLPSKEKPKWKAWSCSTCTLQNPPDFLACDACGTERSPAEAANTSSKRPSERPNDTIRGKSNVSVIDLTDSPPRNKEGSTRGKRQKQTQPPANTTKFSTEQKSSGEPLKQAATWQCSWCGKVMQRQWWTCSSCGRMKDNSR